MLCRTPKPAKSVVGVDVVVESEPPDVPFGACGPAGWSRRSGRAFWSRVRLAPAAGPSAIDRSSLPGRCSAVLEAVRHLISYCGWPAPALDEFVGGIDRVFPLDPESPT